MCAFEEFRERTKNLVDRTIYFVTQLLNKNDLTPDAIDTVLLVGGSTKMPMIQEAVKTMFPDKDGSGQRVRIEEPDFAVAKGAAISAGMKYIEMFKEQQEKTDTTKSLPSDNDNTPVTLSEDTAKSLLEAFGESGTIEVAEILSRSFGPAVLFQDPAVPGGKKLMIDNLLFIGGSSPAEAEETYGTVEDNQEVLIVPVYENTSKEERHVTPSFDLYGNPQATDPALNVQKIGEVRLSLPAGTPKGSPILIRFKCGSNGLTVYATNVTTGDTVDVNIESEFLKSKEKVKSDSKFIGSITTSGTVE